MAAIPVLTQLICLVPQLTPNPVQQIHVQSMVIGVFGLIGLHARCLVVMGLIHEQGYVTIL